MLTFVLNKNKIPFFRMIELDIKKDGKVLQMEYHPTSELKLDEAMRRNGWTVKRLAERIGYSPQAVRQLIEGKPSLTTIYKLAWAMDIDPRDLFFAVDADGNILPEPEPNDDVLKKQIKALELGPLFGQKPQDAQQVMLCPKCGTKFLVMNVPHYVEDKGISEI